MAIVKIEEVYLYATQYGDNAAENIEAGAFMDHSGIDYTRLWYNDPVQHTDVIAAINSWVTSPMSGSMDPITKFPFLVYTEVHDDRPARSSPVKYLEGIDAIKTFPDILNQYK
jgi:hypothetical protein